MTSQTLPGFLHYSLLLSNIHLHLIFVLTTDVPLCHCPDTCLTLLGPQLSICVMKKQSSYENKPLLVNTAN